MLPELNKAKETALTNGEPPSRLVPTYGTVEDYIRDIQKFEVGDYFDIYGSTRANFKYTHQMYMIPKDFELRIHALEAGTGFAIYYPTGYLVWISLAGDHRQFKCVVENNKDGIPYFKIWRAK